MFSGNASTSSTELHINAVNGMAWKPRAFDYHLPNKYEYGTSRRFSEFTASRSGRNYDPSKLYFEQRSILKEKNGEYTVLKAIGEVDFHSSTESFMKPNTVESDTDREIASPIDGNLKKIQDNLERISAGWETPSKTSQQGSKDKNDTKNEDTKSTKSLHSTAESPVPKCIEGAESDKACAEDKTEKHKRKRISASKRQTIMLKDYKKLSRSLSYLVKGQKHIPLKRKGERTWRKELLRKVRRSLKTLRKKLNKREKLYQFEVKKRKQKENRKRQRYRLKKILKVVYSKRKQRIRNMRSLRIQERKRIADNLLLKAAKLRSRANRLTAGRESRFVHRQVQLPKKPGDPIKIITSRNTSPATKKDLVKNTDKVIEKKSCEKKKHKKKLTKLQKQKKKLDFELKTIGINVKKLLHEFSGFCKAPAQRKARKMLAQISKSPLDVSIERMKGGLSESGKPEPNKKKSKKNKKKGKHHTREAWWRKDKLKAAKIVPKEKPIIDDFGSDTDIYDLKIISNEKRITPRHSQITVVKSFS